MRAQKWHKSWIRRLFCGARLSVSSWYCSTHFQLISQQKTKLVVQQTNPRSSSRKVAFSDFRPRGRVARPVIGVTTKWRHPTSKRLLGPFFFARVERLHIWPQQEVVAFCRRMLLCTTITITTTNAAAAAAATTTTSATNTNDDQLSSNRLLLLLKGHYISRAVSVWQLHWTRRKRRTGQGQHNS